MAQPLKGIGTAPRFPVALIIQPQAHLEPKSWEVGASSFLQNTSRWATWNKTPSASRSLKNQLLMEQERRPCVTEEEERKPQYLRVGPQNSAESGPASRKTTQIPPREQHHGINKPVSRSPLQKPSIHVSVPWITCYKKFSVSASVLNCNSVHYIQKCTRTAAGFFWSFSFAVMKNFKNQNLDL